MGRIVKVLNGFSAGFMVGLSDKDITEALAPLGVTILYFEDDSRGVYLFTDVDPQYSRSFLKSTYGGDVEDASLEIVKNEVKRAYRKLGYLNF